MNVKKKYFLIFLLVIIFIYSTYFISNFFLSYSQNKIISFLNSDRFEVFLLQRFDKTIEKLSDGELSDEQKDYYSRIYKKLKIKFEPVFSEKKNN